MDRRAILAAIIATLRTGTIAPEIAGMVSSPTGCGGLDEWMAPALLAVVDSLGASRTRVIDGLHHVASVV